MHQPAPQARLPSSSLTCSTTPSDATGAEQSSTSNRLVSSFGYCLYRFGQTVLDTIDWSNGRMVNTSGFRSLGVRTRQGWSRRRNEDIHSNRLGGVRRGKGNGGLVYYVGHVCLASCVLACRAAVFSRCSTHADHGDCSRTRLHRRLKGSNLRADHRLACCDYWAASSGSFFRQLLHLSVRTMLAWHWLSSLTF